LAHSPFDKPTTMVPPWDWKRFIASMSLGSGAATFAPNRRRTRCLMASSEQRVADTLARAQGTTPPEPKAGSKIPAPER
jgi:hypothetical protein